MLPKTDAAKYAATHNTTTLLPNGKIRFDQTGMEFPSTVTSTVLDAYANGKAFRRAVVRRANEAYDFSLHEPYIVPHKVLDKRHFLYCLLTKATLPRDASIVQNHVSAKRFRRRLAETEKAKQRREELSEKRREKRERAKASRGSTGEKKEELENHTDEENDILDGIISDDDEEEDVSDDGNEEYQAMQSPVKDGEGKTIDAEQNGGATDEDMTEERDDDDEWREPPTREQSTRTTKKKAVAELVDKMVETNSDIPSDHESEPTVTRKRNRVRVQVPKKVRRARQRRKEMKQT